MIDDRMALFSACQSKPSTIWRCSSISAKWPQREKRGGASLIDLPGGPSRQAARL